jgi:hypothetical protein
MQDVLALDADEVLFPFASGYADWRRRNSLPTFDPGSLTCYDFAAAVGVPEADNEHTTAFLADAATLQIPPLDGASAALDVLQKGYRIVVVTNRYEFTQADGTLAWFAKWLPQVDEVIFARRARGLRGPGKAAICAGMHAAWLVDDAPEHLRGLNGTRGVLFGSYPWQHAAFAGPRARTWNEALALLR